jgi:hypothetical protein
MRLSHPRIAVAGTVGLVAALALAAAAVGPAARAQTLIQPESSTGIAGWTQTGSYNESVLSAGEGVATVDPPGGTGYELYRGATSIPLAELINGWTHIRSSTFTSSPPLAGSTASPRSGSGPS